MRKYKMEILKEILQKDTYSVNINLGMIYGRNDCIKNSYDTKNNLCVVDFFHNKKNHRYTAGEVVAFVAGLYKGKNPEHYKVILKDGVPINTRIKNIELVTNKQFREIYKDKMYDISQHSGYCSKYPPELKEEIKEKYNSKKYSTYDLSKMYNIHQWTIWNIIKGGKPNEKIHRPHQ